jgi:hypothetical protein
MKQKQQEEAVMEERTDENGLTVTRFVDYWLRKGNKKYPHRHQGSRERFRRLRQKPS